MGLQSNWYRVMVLHSSEGSAATYKYQAVFVLFFSIFPRKGEAAELDKYTCVPKQKICKIKLRQSIKENIFDQYKTFSDLAWKVVKIAEKSGK